MSDGPSPLYEKPSSAALDYVVTWGLPLASVAWTTAPAGLVLSGHAVAAGRAVVRIAGGAPGQWYTVTCNAITEDGRRDSRTFHLLVRDPAGLGASDPRSVLGDPAGAVASLRRDRLLRLFATHLSGVDLHDDYLWSKLRSAEAEAERRVGVWLMPRLVVPDGTAAAEIAALEAAGERVEVEPGYDYDPTLWIGTGWGTLNLRQRQVRTVERMTFAYPTPGTTLYEIPRDWIRLDHRPGIISLVPTGGSPSGIPLSTWMLGVVGGGRSVPLLVQVRYRAGLADARRDHPDLLDVIRKMAVLAVLDDEFMPSSSSLSADGRSQSISWDPKPYREEVDAKLDRLRQRLEGIRLVGL